MTVVFPELGKYGRFGNQLFQIASTIGIAKNNNMYFAFPKWEYQKYFKNKLPYFNQLDVDKDLEERKSYYYDIKLNQDLSYALYGYFQSYKYFDKYKNLIKHYFLFKDEKFINFDLVGIHVRRGDYLYLDNHPILSEDYYRSAISLFPKHTSFLICSDDIKWCKENFTEDRFLFSGTDDFISDFLALKHCSHNIIANSSFSWWAAYLNNAPNKKVIAPSIYVNNEIRTDDRYPKDWIVI